MSAEENPTAREAGAPEIIALEKRFADAIVHGDLQALDKVVSADWIVVGPEGRITSRAAFFDVVKSGALTHASMESDETRVRVYADTALVTARVVSAGAYQGQAFTTRERSTDVFVRRQGQWKCVLTQLTSIVEK